MLWLRRRVPLHSPCHEAHGESVRPTYRSTEGPAGILSGDEDEVPFARRAREQGRAFRGGKLDGECFGFSWFCWGVCVFRLDADGVLRLFWIDISVLIAVVSPVETAKIASSSS